MYDYDGIRKSISREKIASRPRNLWRYRELLPIEGEPTVGLYSGFTPLIRARRLGAVLGVDELYIKDDSVNHPTFSYKDRVVSVAISKAIEFGYDTVSCASTGNLANSVSAHAASAGLNCYVFIPEGLEEAKIVGSAIYGPRTIAIKGNYDDRQPAVQRDRRQIRMGVRQREPEALLFRGRQNPRLRGRRTVGMETAAPHRRGLGGWNHPAQAGQGVQGAPGRGAGGCGRAVQHLLGPGGGLLPDHQRPEKRHGCRRSGEAQHHRHLHCHR